MVRRVFEAMYQEIRGLHQAAYVLAVFAFGSQILALVRDRLLAHQFGAGIELDIYYAAFRIPDLLFVLFASTLSVYVLIPFVAKRMDNYGESSAKQLLEQVFSLFLLFYIGLALVVFLVAPYLVAFIFPGFDESTQVQIVSVMRVLLLQPLLLGISSLFGVVTQLGKRFMIYAVSPILYNVGIIVGIIFFYPIFGLVGLGLGVVLGAFAHVAVQIPYVRKSALTPAFTLHIEKEAIKSILRTSIPRTLTLSLHQIVFIAMVSIASLMAAGSVSIFQFAYNLQSVPLAIIGVSYSVAAFPTLARLYSKGEHTEFISHVATAIRHILFWSLPAVGLIVVVRAQLVRVILGSGAFDWGDTRLTAAALALFVLSLVAQAINLLIVRAFYAGGNTRIPLIVTLISSIMALFFALLLYGLFILVPQFAVFIETILRVGDVPGTEVLMLPLGYSLALLIHTLILLGLFMQKFKMPYTMISSSFLRAFSAAFVAGGVAYLALNILVVGIKTETFLGIFLQGFIAGVAGLVATVGYLYAVTSPELMEVWHALHRRFFKKDVVVAQAVDDSV